MCELFSQITSLAYSFLNRCSATLLSVSALEVLIAGFAISDQNLAKGRTRNAMIAIRTDNLRKLAALRSDLCVSIYMPLYGLPQDVIRLKNLLDQARDALHTQGMRPAQSRGASARSSAT